MMPSCIGDVTYGKEQAKKYRDIITAFQVDSEDKKRRSSACWKDGLENSERK